MKPLTEKDEQKRPDFLQDTSEIYSIPVYDKKDVQSAVALLKKRLDNEIYIGFNGVIEVKNVLNIYAQYHKIIDECFRIQGQGTAKGSWLNVVGQGNKLSGENTQPCKSVSNPASSQESPAQDLKEYMEAQEEVRKIERKRFKEMEALAKKINKAKEAGK